jgi:hypothetical protein
MIIRQGRERKIVPRFPYLYQRRGNYTALVPRC